MILILELVFGQLMHKWVQNPSLVIFGQLGFKWFQECSEVRDSSVKGGDFDYFDFIEFLLCFS